MMKWLSVFILTFPLVCCAHKAKTEKHVVLISIDGAAPYVIEQTKMPNLKMMAAYGSVSWTAQTIFPSITLPSHTSMTTGVGPEVHGVLWNDWIPEKGFIKQPTIFSIAHGLGFSTALIASKAKFKHLQIPDSLDDFQLVEKNAPGVADSAIKILVNKKPNLTMIHFRDPDFAGHLLGWGSREQILALENVDQALGRILKALEGANMMKDSVLLISADHGGHEYTHGSRRTEDMTIPWIAYGGSANKGLLVQEIKTVDTAATALWLLGIGVPSSFEGRPIESAFGP